MANHAVQKRERGYKREKTLARAAPHVRAPIPQQGAREKHNHRSHKTDERAAHPGHHVCDKNSNQRRSGADAPPCADGALNNNEQRKVDIEQQIHRQESRVADGAGNAPQIRLINRPRPE